MNKLSKLNKTILKKERAFTMMELMIVIAIIAVLSVVMTPKFKTARIEALNRGVEKNAENIVGVTENLLGRSIATNVTKTMLVAEINKQGLKNPAGKTDIAFDVLAALPATPIKGAVYVIVTVGALDTNIEGVDIVKIGADGSALGTLKAGYDK